MKTYSLEDIKKLTNNSQSDDKKIESENTYSLEDLDKAKTRILKFIFYKKRTESEVRKKFSKEYDEILLEDVIEDLKEKDYINDEIYIDRAISDFITLKHLSIKEIKYKLMAKGVKTSEIDNYIQSHEEKMKDYEVNSAIHLFEKKKSKMDEAEIKRYLMKKGYREESIKEAI
ncbi:MAG: RecX family transcriptional regulator [Clostridia bacterium]|nr:RecX family transcriptional regulator [Clostridia bacterium]